MREPDPGEPAEWPALRSAGRRFVEAERTWSGTLARYRQVYSGVLHRPSDHGPPAEVLIVGPLPPPAGGMANQTLQLQRLLTAEGLQLTVVNTQAPYTPGWIAGVRGLRALFRLLPYLLRLWRSMGSVDVVHVMANSGLSWHLFAAPAIRIARWRGKPAIVNYRGGLAREFLSGSAPSASRTFGREAHVPSRFLQQGVVSSAGAEIIRTSWTSRPSSATTRGFVIGRHVVWPGIWNGFTAGLALRAAALIRNDMPDIRFSTRAVVQIAMHVES